MSLNSIIFIDSLPKIDIHGLDRDSGAMYVRAFIKENIKLKQEYFVVVHGIGTGILRKMTHEVLKSEKKVIEFKTFFYNRGCTVVQVNLSK